MIIINQDHDAMINTSECVSINRRGNTISATIKVFNEGKMPRIKLGEYNNDKTARTEFERIEIAIMDKKTIYRMTSK